MTKFRAAVLESLGENPSIVELSVGELQSGQVLVEMVMAGICGSQLSEIAGFKGNAKFLPHLIGHEGFGRVVRIGSGVRSVSPGDEVVLHWRRSSCGLSAQPAKYMGPEGRVVGSGPVATLSEFVVVSEDRVTAVPEGSQPELATLLGCALSTATSALLNEANLSPGDRLLIVGLGGLGISALAASRLVESVTVSGFDTNRDKGRLARRVRDFSMLSAEPEASRGDSDQAIIDEGFDVVIDTVGDSLNIQRFSAVLRPGARYLLVGQGNPEDTIDLGPRGSWIKDESVSIVVSQGGGFQPDTHLREFLQKFTELGLETEGLVTHKFDIGGVSEAIEKLRQGGVARAVIEF